MKQRSSKRKIAVTVWEHRISPVFDSARTLLIAEVDEKSIASASYLTFDPNQLIELVQLLRAQNVMVIICGAVSEGPANMLEAAGFELIPFIAGDYRRVVQTFILGEPFWEEFTMPGCGKRICCQGKIRRGQEINPVLGGKNRGRGK